MQAVRFAGVGLPARIEDVPKPSPGPGQVLVRIGGAGVCHSDLHIMEEELGFTPPFTLGHENAGWVAALGPGTTGFKEGDAVAVYGAWGCGRCHACQRSGGTASGPSSAWAAAITTSITAARPTARR